ncbi:MAG: hypothetical protein K2K83_00250 [Rikenella sp.]|nr:hypothetical protein [Rikenella sp.]
MYFLGNCGFGWASSVAGINAYRLAFCCAWVGPNNSDYRAYGFPLRCLQE